MAMLKTVEGIYRQGKIELTDPPADVEDNTPVIVTFLGSGIADSQSDHVNLAHAADLRSRLAAFAEEWESPEMDIYDDYDGAKTKI
jgi:hypothetical protein